MVITNTSTTKAMSTPPSIRFRTRRARPARNLFAVSILYLFALFASLLAEHLFAIAPLRSLL